jgi:two-component system NtrC family sensor kinase
MPASSSFRLRSFLRVAVPVVVATVFVSLAIMNIALVKTWTGEVEDGVLWAQQGSRVVAIEVAAGHPGARAGIVSGDVLREIEGATVARAVDVAPRLSRAGSGRTLRYLVDQSTGTRTVSVTLETTPTVRQGLYYSLALVGVLTIIVGASVRLRRPHDLATLHFFWLSVAFFGVLAFTPSGRYDRLDYFFDWADLVARLLLPPLFLHFALVFPDRPAAWVRSTAGRLGLVAIYLPAAVLGALRVLVLTRVIAGEDASATLARIEWLAYAYLAVCLVGGLGLMTSALRQLRSVTAERQLRWIAWGSMVGAVPFVLLYVGPLLAGRTPAAAEYSAVLLGAVPLAFASALVRYRLMDIEVIIKRAFGVLAVVLVLALIYLGTLQLVGAILGTDSERSSFWALLATLVVALVAPSLWNAIQTALDRLYYRDRYDYRRALVAFARDLNSDLDLERLSRKLVDRVRDTLGVDRIALYLHAEGSSPRWFLPGTVAGFEAAPPAIDPHTTLGARLALGQTVVIDDAVASRRLPPDETAQWQQAGLNGFVPCVSNDTTIAALAFGQRPHGEPLSTEDIALLGAVAAQAATALQNARLYDQLSVKARELERLRQFSDSVVESLSDGLVVVDRDDRVLRWNRQMETLAGVLRQDAIGREVADLFDHAFLETLRAARRDDPGGAALYRLPMAVHRPGDKQALLVNVAVAPFQTADNLQAGWIIVVEDVTERANLEEQLRLSEKMAAIGLLAAGVAHEVNTPLTGISSFTQLLLDKSAPDDPRTALLEKIEQQTFRAAKIVTSLLNLAKPASGETRVLEINAVIADVLGLLEHQFKMNRIQVRRHLASTPVLVRGVEYKLQQVFLNLFLNARDAMPRGGWLSITTAVSGDEALVEVADTGVGIPAENLARIYDPFFTTKPEGRGTGLGLSVTYGIVQEHGGSLVCDSDEQQGTRFRLVLPAVAEAVEMKAGGDV